MSGVQSIGIGTAANDGTGDTIRNAFNKANGGSGSNSALPGTGWMSVTSYGAIGNGVADDTAGVQAAVDALGDTVSLRGGGLYFPPGTYRITNTILFDRKVAKVFGIGSGDSESAFPAPGSTILWDGIAGLPMFKIKRTWFIEVEGLRFKGKSTAKPSAAIEINVTTGDSPLPTQMKFRHIWIGHYSSFDIDPATQFTNGIITSGDNLQVDQSSMDHIFVQGATGDCIRFANAQNVLWHLSNMVLNGGPTATGIATSARHIVGHNIFFSSNLTDVVMTGDTRLDIYQMGSELSGQFCTAATAGEVRVHGGYWQAGPNIAASGIIVDIAGGGLARFEDFLFTESAGYAGPTEKLKLRGANCIVVLDNVVQTPAVATFLDVDTVTVGDKRRVEVRGLPSGNFQNEWTHGDTNSPESATRYDLGATVYMGQEDWQVPTLQNSWANFGSGFSTWGVYKDKCGQVWLRGFISGGTTADGTLIATLPSGYRPAFKTPVMAYNNASATPQRYQITTAGAISLDGIAAGAIALDGISFRAA